MWPQLIYSIQYILNVCNMYTVHTDSINIDSQASTMRHAFLIAKQQQFV